MYLGKSQKLIFLLLAFLLGSIVPVFADDTLEDLGIIDKSQEQLVSTSRLPRPIKKTAENVTVITSDDIARINAHTLTDVLQTVPGIQFDHIRTPGTFTYFNIQGALNTTVLILVDGIRQNDFDTNIASPGLIPVQMIERIEIIKGAASAAWGPALGGVINIITKTPSIEKKVSGMVSGSIGSQFTADSRAELSGTLDRFDYYLTAGNLHSDGLSPNTSNNQNNLFGKLSYTLPGKGIATFSLSYLTAQPGLDEGNTAKWGFVHDNNAFQRTNSYLNFDQPLGNKFNLNISGYYTNRDDHTKYGGHNDQGSIVFFNDFNVRDTTRGANAKLTWGDSQRSLATGFEYGHAQAKYADLLGTAPPAYDKTWDSWALYGNGSYSIGNLTFLPGMRFDITGLQGNILSYTLGATYQLTEKTTLRTYAAQGFTMPMPSLPSDGLQKIKTIQVGIETEKVPYLWLKGTFFYNTLRNSVSGGAASDVTTTNQDRQGFEIEARTVPFFDFSLSSGYTFLYARDTDTRERLQTNGQQSVPPHLVKLALNYDKSSIGLRGSLIGNFVSWNSSVYPPAKEDGMVWDLHLNWKLYPKWDMSPELFFSGHNLINSNQTVDSTLYNTASRWFDGGLRLRF